MVNTSVVPLMVFHFDPHVTGTTLVGDLRSISHRWSPWTTADVMPCPSLHEWGSVTNKQCMVYFMGNPGLNDFVQHGGFLKCGYTHSWMVYLCVFHGKQPSQRLLWTMGLGHASQTIPSTDLPPNHLSSPVTCVAQLNGTTQPGKQEGTNQWGNA